MNLRHIRPYDLFFEHRPFYLYAYVRSSEHSYQIAHGYWVEILSMVHRRRYARVLIEKNITKPLSAFEAFDLVSELSHSKCDHIKIAVYDRHYDPDECQFEELVGTNRGMRFKISDDRLELEDWLANNASVPPAVSGTSWAVNAADPARGSNLTPQPFV